MGNVVLWKPSSDAAYVPILLMEIFKEAGLPDGVINLVPCKSSDLSDIAFTDERFAGIHFTGGTATFKTDTVSVSKNTLRTLLVRIDSSSFKIESRCPSLRIAVNSNLRPHARDGHGVAAVGVGLDRRGGIVVHGVDIRAELEV